MERPIEQRNVRALAPAGAMAVGQEDERSALLRRFDLAKERFLQDLGQAAGLLQAAAGRARRGALGAVVVVGGMLLVGVAAAIVRRRRRRLSIAWK